MCVLSASIVAAEPVSAHHPTKSGVAPASAPTTLPAAQSVFVTFDKLAAAATAGGASDIQVFVNDYLVRSVVYGVGPSVSARVTSLELAYRDHKRGPVNMDDIVRAINTTVDRYSAPAFMKTSRLQVQYYTELMERRVPHLRELSCDHDDRDNTLSPAQAVFILTELVTQKLMNGSYQLPADTWVRRTKARIKAAELFPSQARIYTDPVIWQPPLVLRSVMEEPPSDSNGLTRLVHGILDDLGLPRR